MGSIPKFLRFLPRKLGFDPTIKKGRFPEKQRGPAVFAIRFGTLHTQHHERQLPKT
jgi:hypothetical protein